MRLKSVETTLIVRIGLLLVLVLSAIAWGVYAYFKSLALAEVSAGQGLVTDVIEHALMEKSQLIRKSLDRYGRLVPYGPLTPQAAQRFIDRYAAEEQLFNKGIVLVDAAGRVLAGTAAAPYPRGTDLSRHPFHVKTVAGRNGVTFEPDLHGSVSCLVSTAPLLDRQGRYRGAVLGLIDLKQDNFLQALINHKVPNNGYIYIFNHDQTLILHPNRERIFTSVPRTSNRGFQLAARGFEGSIETLNSRGIPQLATFKQVGEIEWVIAVVAPLEQIYRPIVTFRNWLALIMVLIVAAGVGIIRLVIRQTVENLNNLSKHIRDARRTGQITQAELLIDGDDEVVEIARGFNLLMDEVNQYRSELERHNMHLAQEIDGQTAELRSSEEKLRTILDSAAEAIYGTDLEGNCTFCNAACLRMLGYNHSDQLIGRNMHPLIHHSRRDGTSLPVDQCRIYGAFAGHTTVHADDEVFWRLDGSCFPVEYWSYPQYHNGTRVGSVVTFFDIGERIQSQKRLLQLSSAVENSPSMILITDLEGRIEYVNPKFIQVTGYAPEEVIGRNPSMLNAGRLPGGFFNDLWSTILGGREWKGDLYNRKKNGECYWERASISPIRNGNGIITNFVAIKEDITEQKRIAEELQQARESADAANRAKSEFLANMSHEIRTPLSAIIGFSELALQGELPPRQHEYLKNVCQAGNSLIGIVNDILDFSKIEAGKLDMEQTLFNLGEVLVNTMAVLQHKAQEKGLAMRLERAPRTPAHLLGDAHRLSQVLINLLGNAVKFTERGAVRLAVDLLDESKDGITLQFSVHDTGIGLTREQIGKLFQPFTQADGSTTRRFGGTGLGLSISRKLVEMMGGHIWCESQPGAGSTFAFTARFGLQTAAAAGAPVQADGEADIVQSAVDLSGSRILLAEDNEICRKLACELLERSGATVGLARNGAEAVELVLSGQHSYDVVLMDIQMPIMDGYQATRTIKADNRFSTLPIIPMTAHVLVVERQQMAEAGMVDYIPKPLHKGTMLATIGRHIPAGRGVKQIDRGAAVRKDNPLPAIPGLDMEGALARIDGDRELYLEVLTAFARLQGDSGNLIQQALNEGDLGVAERIAHTIKGNANAIGAMRLGEVAHLLETSIRNRDGLDAVHAHLAFFSAELDGVVQTVLKTLPVSQADC